jgi:glycosyltransferase involved in cell wall biosynthesis
LRLRTTYQLGIVGKFPEEQKLQLLSKIRKAGLRDHVVFIGYAPDEDLQLLYNSCALFVLPSLHKGFGLPVLEAMAAVLRSSARTV